MSLTSSDLFADATIISTYTRAQAIEDGVLVDVSPVARAIGFRCPVAISESLWRGAVEQPALAAPASEHDATERQQLVALLTVAGNLLKRPGRDLERARFAGEDVLVVAGPGDAGEPVVTIMLPEDY